LTNYNFPLGINWYDKFYTSISSSLGYSKESDERSRDELSLLIEQKNLSSFDEAFTKLISRFKKRNCLVFGAGPSLENDIMTLYPIARKAKNLVIAADGATDTLLEAMIVPQITVSDLDSSSERVLISQSEDRTIFVHAHGDNADLIRKLVPEMGRNIFGTTQVPSVDNVRNLGGLMDGDRACYLASLFEPHILVIAGMDFAGREGDTPEKRALKLQFGKQSLEFLIERKPQIRFVNFTSYGETIAGAERIEITTLIEALS
jgi:2-amino-4-hydroxy-6-hydroxymethyldihydropteridine diphosphokinase